MFESSALSSTILLKYLKSENKSLLDLLLKSYLIFVLKFDIREIPEEILILRSPSFISKKFDLLLKFFNKISVLSAKKVNEDSFRLKFLKVSISKSEADPRAIKLSNWFLSFK